MTVNIDRVICSILLGVLTYDANLLIIQPAKEKRRMPDADLSSSSTIPADWPLDIPGVEVVAARAYLADPRYTDLRRPGCSTSADPTATRASAIMCPFSPRRGGTNPFRASPPCRT